MGFMDFFHRMTPQEKLRKYKRTLDRTSRDLERERSKLIAQEKRLIIDMKKMAKQSEMDALTIMARDLVRTRKYNQKIYRMRTQLQGITLKIQTMSSTTQMATAMKGVSKAMKSINKNLNIPEMQRIMREFEKENDLLDMKDEMVTDVIDNVMDEEDVEEETEQEIQKVIDEVGIDLRNMGVKKGDLQAKPTEEEIEEDKELDARLAALKSSMK
ncbi:unnamed protein product [Phytomonas sp. Hart1]|nr:unnamed protein product [Phytomonas sp. Hart1]|eukprot:CCW71057.1 unnamed protein product [Phytomonas sp. isolate Hart1]